MISITLLDCLSSIDSLLNNSAELTSLDLQNSVLTSVTAKILCKCTHLAKLAIDTVSLLDEKDLIMLLSSVGKTLVSLTVGINPLGESNLKCPYSNDLYDYHFLG